MWLAGTKAEPHQWTRAGRGSLGSGSAHCQWWWPAHLAARSSSPGRKRRLPWPSHSRSPGPRSTAFPWCLAQFLARLERVEMRASLVVPFWSPWKLPSSFSFGFSLKICLILKQNFACTFHLALITLSWQSCRPSWGPCSTHLPSRWRLICWDCTESRKAPTYKFFLPWGPLPLRNSDLSYSICPQTINTLR